MEVALWAIRKRRILFNRFRFGYFNTKGKNMKDGTKKAVDPNGSAVAGFVGMRRIVVVVWGKATIIQKGEVVVEVPASATDDAVNVALEQMPLDDLPIPDGWQFYDFDDDGTVPSDDFSPYVERPAKPSEVAVARLTMDEHGDLTLNTDE
jgi:hypothetical protein